MNSLSPMLRQGLAKKLKIILPIVGVLLLLMMLALFGAGYFVWKAISGATPYVASSAERIKTELVAKVESVQSLVPGESVQSLVPGESVQSLAPAAGEPGIIAHTVGTLGSMWLTQAIAASPITEVQRGLACIQALGGPTPQALVDSVSRNVKDQQAVEKLNSLSDKLAGLGIPANSNSCVTWIAGNWN